MKPWKRHCCSQGVPSHLHAMSEDLGLLLYKDERASRVAYGSDICGTYLRASCSCAGKAVSMLSAWATRSSGSSMPS